MTMPSTEYGKKQGLRKKSVIKSVGNGLSLQGRAARVLVSENSLTLYQTHFRRNFHSKILQLSRHNAFAYLQALKDHQVFRNCISHVHS